MNVLLVTTHLTAFFAGIIAAYWWILWGFGVRDADRDHVTLEIHHHPHGGSTAVNPRRTLRANWLAIALLVASLFVIAIGLQAYSAKKHDNESRARDRAIVTCVRAFSKQIAEVYAVRADASQQLEAATKRKSDAQDAVFFAAIRLRANREDPQASDNFDKALVRFRAAARHRDRVAARVNRLRAENPPPDPAKAVCDG